MSDKIINGSLEVTGQITQNGESLDKLVKITWSSLKTLRDNSQLVPGRFYRITDYTCTTTTENTSSAGHLFDIIVVALDESHLSEEAWAAHHESNESEYVDYFASSKLEAWKL